MKLLVTGGAGYIGSVVAAQLVEAGHQVTVLDDLSTGHADAVPAAARFVEGSITEAADVLPGMDGVLHFAAKSLVGESVQRPGLYWAHNLGGTLTLLDAMRTAGVGRIVFSSTAATYGEPERSPVLETDPTRPTNPYGASKLAVDTALTTFAGLYGLAAVSLRYFNVGGAYTGGDGRVYRERHTVETHLIPNVLAVALGGRESVSVFGTDYPTPDGTCVRDYIHVADLARAHLLALEACSAGNTRSTTWATARASRCGRSCRSAARSPGTRSPRWCASAAPETRRCWWRPRRGSSGSSDGNRNTRPSGTSSPMPGRSCLTQVDTGHVVGGAAVSHMGGVDRRLGP